jgi:hypothetical protein
VSVLAGRVQEPTDVDKLKLDRLLNYINGSKDIGITLFKAVDYPIAYIDASYAVHEDCKSHSGVVITLGAGPVYVSSTKQKIVAKSSTEAELIAVSDGMGEVLWLKNFMFDQSNYDCLHDAKVPSLPAKVYQDNLSTIALLTTGKIYSGRTKHINIRYFFVRDRWLSDEIIIEYMPTESMIADLFTKPLSGSLFRYLRMILLNYL